MPSVVLDLLRWRFQEIHLHVIQLPLVRWSSFRRHLFEPDTILKVYNDSHVDFIWHSVQSTFSASTTDITVFSIFNVWIWSKLESESLMDMHIYMSWRVIKFVFVECFDFKGLRGLVTSKRLRINCITEIAQIFRYILKNLCFQYKALLLKYIFYLMSKIILRLVV